MVVAIVTVALAESSSGGSPNLITHNFRCRVRIHDNTSIAVGDSNLQGEFEDTVPMPASWTRADMYEAILSRVDEVATDLSVTVDRIMVTGLPEVF